MAYTPVTYRVVVVEDPLQDFAVRYATAEDIADLPTSRSGLDVGELYVRDDIPPPTRLTVTQSRAVVSGNLFQTTTTVTESFGIQPQVFVFRTIDQSYSHVAVVRDMDEWPVTQEEAEEAELGFYRQASCVVSYDTVETADEFAAYTLERVEFLTDQYSAYKLTFEGSDTHVYVAP